MFMSSLMCVCAVAVNSRLEAKGFPITHRVIRANLEVLKVVGIIQQPHGARRKKRKQSRNEDAKYLPRR